MALTDAQKFAGAREFARRRFRILGETANLDADEVKAAFNAAVTFVQNNKAIFNMALPQPFKGTATPEQKAELFAIATLFETGVV